MHFPHRTLPRTGLVAATLILALAGCENMPASGDIFAGSVGGTTVPGVLDGPARLTIEERDVEAPDVFELTDMAIWDGRPSFGGVWAAVPGNVQPERVRIENTASGQSVVGALFKREAENPGPPIEISSDAAAALGVIPGESTEIKIIALRREAVDVTPPIDTERGPDPVATTTLAPITDPDAVILDDRVDTTTITAAIDEAPDTAPATAGPAPDKPFIQVGTFQSQSNAEGLVEILSNNNIAAQVRSETMNNGRVLHRVLAGPAATDGDLATLADRVSALGFTDAFPVSG